MDCPSIAELARLESAGARARAALERHLERCRACRRAHDELRRDAALFEDLRRAANPPDAAVDTPPGYRIESEIHRGGQGVVYAAVHLASNRRVALKLPSSGRHATGRQRLRFEREVDLAARLSHPDIVRLYDSGLCDGSPWYAMELVPGRRLDEHLAEQPLSLDEKLRLFERIGRAVAHAHRCGVIHRDLKPANVLVTADGSPKVLDFGVARAAGADEDERGARGPAVTQTGEFMGTLAYAAPEQVRGETAALDTRSDVYALGVLLYEMLCGRLPYDVGADISSAVHDILHAPPRAPGRALDGELWLIVRKALEKEPDERYASVDALLRDLERYRRCEPLEARPHSLGYVLRKTLWRHKLGVATAAAVLAVALLAGTAIVRERLRARGQREQAELVRQVFQDVLAAASPERMGRDVRVLEVFEEAARRIETVLGDAPDAQGAVHLTIGDTYRRLLMHEEAVPHLRVALARYRRVDERSPDVARCLELLGLALSELGQAEAVELQREALALRRAVLPPGHPAIAASLRALAIAHASRYVGAEHELAARRLREALALLEAAGPAASDGERAETLAWLARTEARLGHDERAGPLYERALALFDDADPRDPRAVECLNAYSDWLRDRGRFDEAETWLRRAVARMRALWGEERSTEMLRSFARLEHARGHAAAAERLSREALANELERCAPAGSDGDPARAIATGLRDEYRREHPRLYAQAFSALIAARGEGAFELTGWANGLAATLRALDRAAEAEPLLRAVLPVHCRAWGERCPLRMRTLLLLGELLVESERGTEARALLEEALAISRGHGLAERTAQIADRLALARRAEEREAETP